MGGKLGEIFPLVQPRESASHYLEKCAQAMLKKLSWKMSFVSGMLQHVPRKIRQLVSDLEAGGFVRVHGGKGSHRKFRHGKFPGFVLLSGHDGDDAQHYQEKQVRHALRQIQS